MRGGGADIEQRVVVGAAEPGLIAATRRIGFGSAGAGKKAKRSMVRLFVRSVGGWRMVLCRWRRPA